MLIYNQAQDCYHTTFRFLQLLEENRQNPIDLEKIKILDFYLLFPAELAKLKYPRSLLTYKSEFKKRFNPYGSIQNASRLFQQIEPLQIVALHALASRNLLDSELLRKHKLCKRTSTPIQAELQEALRARTLKMGNLVYFLANELSTLNLHGPGGLKDRSGLLAHKYDFTPPQPPH